MIGYSTWEDKTLNRGITVKPRSYDLLTQLQML